jgi:hypothetical protein
MATWTTMHEQLGEERLPAPVGVSPPPA